MRTTRFITALLLLVALAALAAPPPVEAQPTRQVPRIGVLDGGSDATPAFAAFRQGLRELGYAEGDNLLVELRSAEGKPDRLPQFAADLVRLKVDVIVAVFATPARAAHQATRSIPIVMIAGGDPRRHRARGQPRPARRERHWHGLVGTGASHQVASPVEGDPS